MSSQIGGTICRALLAQEIQAGIFVCYQTVVLITPRFSKNVLVLYSNRLKQFDMHYWAILGRSAGCSVIDVRRSDSIMP